MPLTRMVVTTDMPAVYAKIVQAKMALLEGQFPPRVGPWSHDGARYPIFQFYGALQSTVGGLISLAFNANPHRSLMAMAAMALMIGGYGTYRLARWYTRHVAASALAGVLFILAPYQAIDLHVRGAIAEFLALNLLPITVFCTLRCYSSRRWSGVPQVAMAWTAIGLAHNITYVYSATFVALLVFSYAPWTPHNWNRTAKLLVAGLAHGSMMLWYFVPQLVAMSYVVITNSPELTVKPWQTVFLAVPEVLFALRRTVPDGSSTADLALQVGWLLLAGPVIVLLLVITRRVRRRWASNAVRLLLLFAVALYMTWSPHNFWQYLPEPYLLIQYTYRLLVFVVLWGALLGAMAFAQLQPHRLTRGWIMGWLCAIAFSALPYMVHHRVATRAEQGDIISRPLFTGANFDYLMMPSAVVRTSYGHPESELGGIQYGLADGVSRRERVPVLVPPGASTLAVTFNTGEPLTLDVSLGDVTWSRQVNPGRVEVHVQVPATDHKRVLDFFAIGTNPEGNQVRPTLTAARWVDAPPATVELMPPEVSRWKMRLGRRSVWRGTLNEETLVVLPVLYYPDLLRFRHNGQTVEPMNEGRYVAMLLPPGKHRLDVTFRGVWWANWISGGAWAFVGGSLVWIGVERARSRMKKCPRA